MRSPLVTERLVLRDWRTADYDRLCAISLMPGVLAGIGPPVDVHARVRRFTARPDMARPDGYCFLAMERRDDGLLIGWCGLKRGDVDPIAGSLEIGWTVADDHTGRGYAREAAEAVLAEAARMFPGETIWAITAQANRASWGLMRRLDMVHCPDLDFDHPAVAPDSPLLRHVVYFKELRP